MSDENSTSKRSILYTVLITLLLGGSAPWWFDKLFPKKTEVISPVTSTQGTATSDAAPSTGTTAPAPVQSQVTQPFELDEFGRWGRSISGDNEMDTDDGDVVPIRFISEIIRTESSVRLRISLYIREDGGDHTTFDHTMEKLLFPAPAGKKIVDVRVRGDQYTARFDHESRGQNHGLTSFHNVAGTYWNSLRFRVDGPGSDDNTVIGVRGSMTCIIVLEDR